MNIKPNINFTSLEAGHAELERVQRAITEINEAMTGLTDNAAWNKLMDVKYDLIQAKRKIQSRMGGMVVHK